MSRSAHRATSLLVFSLLMVTGLAALLSLTNASPAGAGTGSAPSGQPLRDSVLEIRVETEFDGQFTIARLGIATPDKHPDWHYLWALPSAVGIGSLQSDDARELLAVFASAGQHQASVVALNLGNAVMAQGHCTIPVTQAPLPAFGAGPGPYRTLAKAGSLVALDSPIRAVTGGSQTSFPLLARAGRFFIHQALDGGYFRLDGSDGESWFVFVSPLPSNHVDRSDRDWYLTQFNTETTSNCGPTATAMGINWAKGIRITVKDIRGLVGWEGNGAVSLEQLMRVCQLEGVQARIQDLRRPEDIFSLLARDELLIVSYDMVGLRPVADPVHNLLGQYYVDSGGHYLTLKGFSLDRRWVVVYDPIPSDWAANALRYPDGASMLGRNRYYPIDELWQALNARQALVIGKG